MSSSLAREETKGAFETLYRAHRGDVYRFVLRDVRNPDDAEDVTQTAFLNAYRALQHGDRPERPRAWLFTIAQNVAKRRFRTRSARPQEVELDPEAFEAPEPEGPSAGEIREALLRLRPNYRGVIVLREIGGLSYAEIADTLGLSVSAVETLLFRARRALREELADERASLRFGGFVLPLPVALTKPFTTLAAWFGRRVATAQVAGALGAAAVGVSVGVGLQTGAFSGPTRDSAPVAAAARPSADLPAREVREARSPSLRSQRRGGPKAEKPSGGAAQAAENDQIVDGSVLGVQVPALPLPDVPLPSPPLPDADAADLDPPELPLPEVEPPPLPDAEELLP